MHFLFIILACETVSGHFDIFILQAHPVANQFDKYMRIRICSMRSICCFSSP